MEFQDYSLSGLLVQAYPDDELWATVSIRGDLPPSPNSPAHYVQNEDVSLLAAVSEQI